MGRRRLLDRLLVDQPRSALRPVLKHKRDILDPASHRRVPEEHLTPKLGHEARWVPARAEAKVANHHAAHVIVCANGQCCA